MTTISTMLKSMAMKVPPIKAIVLERDELHFKVGQLDHYLLQSAKCPTLNKDKLELIDFAFTSQGVLSFADLGGVWRVDGGYTFYALEAFNPTKAVLVDTHPTEATLRQSKKHAQFRFIHGNFGGKPIAQEVGQVDAVFLFDVLLHQVAPSWDEVLDVYSDKTRCFVIFNPQWVGSSSTVRLLDLGEDLYFQNVPHNKNEEPYDNLFRKLHLKHPDHDRTWRDVHHIWQWGTTDEDLMLKAKSLGFKLQYYKNCGPFGNLKNFENHAFVFRK